MGGSTKNPGNVLPVKRRDIPKVTDCEAVEKLRELLMQRKLHEKEIMKEHAAEREDEDENWLDEWLDAKIPKLVDVKVPVIHKFNFKYIEEEDGNLFMIGSLIQTMCGVSPQDKHDPSIRPYFQYRFNDRVATDDQFQFRRSRVHMEEHYRALSITASVRIPLQKQVVFSRNPFVIMKASANIELSTFEMGNIQFRPDLLVDEDYVTEEGVNTGSLFREFFIIKNPHSVTCDKMTNFDLVSVYPSIKVIYQPKKDYTSEFKISFWVHEPITQKTVTTLFPITIILVLASLNVFAIQEIGDFIANTSSIVLTLVFLLPLMYPQTDLPSKFSTNDVAVGLIFAALLINCFKTLVYAEFSGVEPTKTLWEAAESTNGNVILREFIVPSLVLILSIISTALPFRNYLFYKETKKSIKNENEGSVVVQKKLAKFEKLSNIDEDKKPVSCVSVQPSKAPEDIQKIRVAEIFIQGYHE